MATCLRKLDKFKEAAFHYQKSTKPLSKSFQLECLYNAKDCEIDEFYKVMDELLEAKVLNPLAACLSSHAAIRFEKEDKYSFCKEPFNFIKKINLFESEDLSDDLIDQLLQDFNSAKITTRGQSLLKNGVQTSGNLFNLEFDSVKKLKSIIEEKIDIYRKDYELENDGFIQYWPKKYKIWGWIIVIKDGGQLLPHMHKEGWLSSSIYLKRPKKLSKNDGDIQFSLDGANYPTNDKIFKNSITEIEKGDMVMFPSSLFHSTIPFHSKEDRVTLAFDVMEIPS